MIVSAYPRLRSGAPWRRNQRPCAWVSRNRAERRVEVGELRMAVVPADELGRADHTWKILAGDAELAVMRSADGEDRRVVEFKQLGDRRVSADGDIADEIDTIAFGDLVVALA